MEISNEKFLKLPQTPGVYTFWKKNIVSKINEPIYIGKSINLKSRLLSYLLPNLGVKTAQMIKEAEKITFIEVFSELESLLLESALIKKFQPKYNIISKDDKHALYILITNEKFPRVITSRKSTNEKILAIFGPFPNSTNVKIILKMIRRIFPYSDHKIGKKPCLYSHIGLCNPCPNTAKDNKEYMKNINRIKLVLSRKFNIVRRKLVKEMDNFSKQTRYEEAALIREKIKSLDYITEDRIPEERFLENPNLVEDQKNEELDKLKKLLKVKNLKRVECYDVAHLSGTSATASMVVFINGEPEKEYYRHFRIKQNKGNSDYDSMKEISRRRVNHITDWGKPNLIIVDGGLGQISIFNKEFGKYNILIVGIAKNPDRLIFLDGRKVRLSGKALNLVSRIRDEAHRFARGYHHKLIKLSLLT
ncbi:MAG TPA: GIY-YIG nuclease family protein [Patescibacteria group bacterium]|nr:GIY-YIG nuclease family protein [Patescibacteria group bacterium]